MKNKLTMIMNFKNILSLTIFFQVGFLSAAAMFNPMIFNAGQSRVFEVMYKGPGGIEEVNRKTLFAEIKNLSLDLNLLAISSRFGCQTKMGQAFIAYTLEKLVSPKDKSATIKSRQDLIKLLIDHPELQEKLENLIQDAVEQEAVVMKFMENRFVAAPSDNPIKMMQQWMGRSTLWQTLSMYWSATTVFGDPVYLWDSALAIPQNYVATVDKAYNLLAKANDLMRAVNHKDFVLSNASKSLLVWIAAASGKFAYDSGLTLLNIGAPADNAARRMSRLWAFALSAKNIYDHYTQALEIRRSLYAFNRLIDISRQIEAICEEHNVAHQFKLSSVRTQEGLEFLQQLEHDRYKEKDSKFFLTTAVNTFMYDVYEKDIYLAPMYASIAEMDAYVAIAKKMKKLQNADHQLTFAQFIDAEKPTIHAKDFWNTLVSVGDIVTNDISEDRNIILTGSNEGGKTTAIRAILQNIVLAQTFGIAAASSFELTPFDVVHSYLNISDDILSGKSRFALELKQAKDILDRVKALKSNQKLFFALDELFTGTNGEDGAEAAYGFIDNIASYPRIQFIYATHFNKLKTIGSNNPACVNYKIEPPLRNDQGEFIRDEKGQLIYPYKLSPGANDVNVALDRAKDAGIFS